jgi:hypothetical protein
VIRRGESRRDRSNKITVANCFFLLLITHTVSANKGITLKKLVNNGESKVKS